MSKVIKIFIVLFFSVYWIATILYNLPSEIFKKKFNKERATFGILFYQNWSFFAPPPTNNNNIYYIFYTEKGTDSLFFDPYLPIMKNLRVNFYYGASLKNVEYILSNCEISIHRNLGYSIELIKKQYPDSSTVFHLQKARETMDRDPHAYAPVKTILNYGVEISKKYNLKAQGYNTMKFILTSQDIPDIFVSNDPSNKLKNEQIVLYSSKLTNI